MAPWLTQPEIDDLCRPITQSAAQIRHLQRLGLSVKRRPNGSPVVTRVNFDAVMNPQAAACQPLKREPNRTALIAAFARA